MTVSFQTKSRASVYKKQNRVPQCINRSSRPKVISHETRVVSPEILIKSVCNISRPLSGTADLATQRERQLTMA